MGDKVLCSRCHDEIDGTPIPYDPEAEYNKIIAFLCSLEHTCKTTLDIGIRMKDFLDKNRKKLEAYITPF